MKKWLGNFFAIELQNLKNMDKTIKIKNKDYKPSMRMIAPGVYRGGTDTQTDDGFVVDLAKDAVNNLNSAKAKKEDK